MARGQDGRVAPVCPSERRKKEILLCERTIHTRPVSHQVQFTVCCLVACDLTAG